MTTFRTVRDLGEELDRVRVELAEEKAKVQDAHEWILTRDVSTASDWCAHLRAHFDMRKHISNHELYAKVDQETD